ncbi:hypothetical protein ACJVDH_05920 [Pedobacter sp. AW1-32]|uniref:hypothetical protein n=1 Tax=Pedobacter sp. AW1-32 TaxID=3383026 RepID=UPI003FEF1CC4
MKNLYVLGLSLSFCLLFIRKGNAQVLGYAQGDFVEIDSKQGITGNTFIRKLWLYRDSPGNNWWSTSLYDGIAIDISFLNPGVDARTWWKRDPYNEIQSWGTKDQTYMTLKGDRFGIGTSNPLSRLEVNGDFLLGGGNLDINGTLGNLSYLAGSGKLLIGWNRSGGGGETDFISNQGPGANGGFSFYNFDNNSNLQNLMWIHGNGNVGIGTSNPQERLSVNGKIGASEIQVRSTGWPDYVFKPEYALPSLADIEKQIKQNGHLPEMPSAAEVETNGIALGEMNKLLLKKVEELTLHLIQQGKEIEQLKKQISKR